MTKSFAGGCPPLFRRRNRVLRVWFAYWAYPHVLGSDARFRLATLLRLEPASARPLLSVAPLDSLFWVLCAVDVGEPATRPAAGAPSTPPHIEWWCLSCTSFDRFETSCYDGHLLDALHLAAKSGHSAVLDWWLDRWPRRLDLPDIDRDDAIREALEAAASADRVDALRWLEAEAGLPAYRFLTLDYGDDALQLEQLRKRKVAALAPRGERPANPPVVFDLQSAAEQAVRHGQVRVLDWLRATGWDFADSFETATACGQSLVLEWWRETYPNNPRCPSWYSMQQASRNGHVKVLQFWWDLRGRAAVNWNRELLHFAAVGGQAEVLQWWSERFPFTGPADAAVFAREASQRNDVALLEWFKTSGYVRPLVCFLTVAAFKKEAYEWWPAADSRNDTADHCGVPADLAWPQLDLLTVATTRMFGRGREGLIDGLEDHKKRALATNVPVLEWLLVRGFAVPHEVEDAAGDSLFARRWWAEVKRRAAG
ncbi:hypothetical protein DFJ73DRAFT_804019 [Zopfochytrium polystomum]|nr:hypothetical protein DFJ73DRAFT_804019 [Zopfochytrium polystomum]